MSSQISGVRIPYRAPIKEKESFVDEYAHWLGKVVELKYNDEWGIEVVSETGILTGLKIESLSNGSNVWHWARLNDRWYPLGKLSLKD